MTKKGFTLIELLIGLAMSVGIFIIVTNIVVSLLFTTTKEQRLEDISAAKNDIETEFSTNARWAEDISYSGGVFTLDTNKYTIDSGKLLKNGVPLTSDKVLVNNFSVVKQTITMPITNSGSGQGLTGSYYSGVNFDNLVTTHTDYGVDFDWGINAPAVGVPADLFSIRWTGQIEIPNTGQYTFYVSSDDGSRLWINNVLVTNDWTDHSMRESRGNITLTGGQMYDVRLEYYDRYINARVKFSWSGPSIAKDLVPPTILHEVAAQSSLNISMDLVHKDNNSVRDALSIFVSPREGLVQSIEPGSPPPTYTPTPSRSPSPTASPGPATSTPNPRR